MCRAARDLSMQVFSVAYPKGFNSSCVSSVLYVGFYLRIFVKSNLIVCVHLWAGGGEILLNVSQNIDATPQK